MIVTVYETRRYEYDIEVDDNLTPEEALDECEELYEEGGIENYAINNWDESYDTEDVHLVTHVGLESFRRSI